MHCESSCLGPALTHRVVSAQGTSVRLRRLNESRAAVEAMAVLWKRLRVEATRSAASPAERLLDDALQILGSRTQRDYSARKQVKYCLQRAMCSLLPRRQPLSRRGVESKTWAAACVSNRREVSLRTRRQTAQRNASRSPCTG